MSNPGDHDPMPPLEILIEVVLATEDSEVVQLTETADLEARRTAFQDLHESTAQDLQIPLLRDMPTEPPSQVGTETDVPRVTTTTTTTTTTTEDGGEPTSVQPILSSIRDLRSALHERVLNLGHEVEQLRARAAAVERGFADNRRQRMADARMVALLGGEEIDVDGEGEGEVEPSGDRPEPGDPPGPWSLSSFVNRFSAAQPADFERNRDEDRYEVVKGSGSAETEGSKEERRQKRLNQVKVESVSFGSDVA
jgi:hypothetical protein